MRAVVKVGSSSLHDGQHPHKAVFHGIADQIEEMREQEDRQFVVVSSGAIAFGRAECGIEKPSAELTVPEKQALASVGQCYLMQAWQEAFEPYSQVGQVLVTDQELFARGYEDESYRIQDTIDEMLTMGFMPIINENDTAAVDEIKLGDNDRLSAHMAHLIGADLLFLLGAEDAFYRNFGRKSQKRVGRINIKELSRYRNHARTTLDPRGTGGMSTKFDAAEIFLQESDRLMYIARASEPRVLEQVMDGALGTIFES